MIANIFGSDGLIVLMIAVVVLFGGSQLPKLAKNVGAAGHEFRRAQREAEAEHQRDEVASSVRPLSVPPTAAPGVPVVTAPVLATGVPTPAADDKLVMSRSELHQELARMMEERQKPAAG